MTLFTPRHISDAREATTEAYFNATSNAVDAATDRDIFCYFGADKIPVFAAYEDDPEEGFWAIADTESLRKAIAGGAV